MCFDTKLTKDILFHQESKVLKEFTLDFLIFFLLFSVPIVPKFKTWNIKVIHSKLPHLLVHVAIFKPKGELKNDPKYLIKWKIYLILANVFPNEFQPN